MDAASSDELSAALALFHGTLLTLSQTDWDRPSPCALWTVRDVANHAVATTTKFTDFAEGLTDQPRPPAGDVLGPSPLAAVEAAAVRSGRAWPACDGTRRCHMSFGEFSAGEAAAINAFDLLVHAWDVTVAVDAERFVPPPGLVQLAGSVAARLVTPDAVAMGVYGRAGVQVTGSAWNDVLIRTGRLP